MRCSVPPVRADVLDARAQRFVARQTPRGDGGVDDVHALRDDASAAEVHVADFAVAHDAFWQADGLTRCLQRRPRIARRKRVPVRAAVPRRSRCRARSSRHPQPSSTARTTGRYVIRRGAAAGDQRREAVAIERRAADEAAVDVRLRAVGRRRSPVSCCRRRESARRADAPRRRANRGHDAIRFGRVAVPARADRPDRFVRDDRRARPRRRASRRTPRASARRRARRSARPRARRASLRRRRSDVRSLRERGLAP